MIDNNNNNVIQCPYCRADNLKKHNFCVSCGSSLSLERNVNSNDNVSDNKNNLSVQKTKKISVVSIFFLLVGFIFSFCFLLNFGVMGIFIFVLLVALNFVSKKGNNPSDRFFRGFGKMIVVGGLMFMLMMGMCIFLFSY